MNLHPLPPVPDDSTLTAEDFGALADVIFEAYRAGVAVTRVTLDLDFLLVIVEDPFERDHLAKWLGLTRRQTSGSTERITDADARVILAGPLEVEHEELNRHDLLTVVAEQHREADREERAS